MHTSTFLKIGAIISLLFLAANCTKDNTIEMNTIVNSGVTFRAELAEPITMAPIESDNAGLVTSGDVTGIQILRGANGTLPAFNALAAPTTTATLNAEGVLTPAVKMKLNTDGTAANFLAYYPEATTFTPDLSDVLKVGWTIDGTQDIIASEPVVKHFLSDKDSVVTLHFDHLLARIELKVKAYNQANLDFYKGIEEAYIVIPNKIEMHVSADGSFNSYCTSEPEEEEDWTIARFGEIELATSEEKTSSSYVMLWPDVGSIRNGEICIRFKGLPNEVQHYSISDLELEAGKTSRVHVTVGSSLEPAKTAYYGTANCHEVHIAGSYSFDITPYTTTVDGYPYRARINHGLPIPRSGKMLWSDVSSNHISNVTVTENSDGSYTLSYDCDGTAGNAVIAVYDKVNPADADARILWSYHIWVSNRSELSDQKWSVINTTDRTIVKNKYTMMDRNLGATSNVLATAEDNSAYGLFYQWGRKDPFVGSSTNKSTTPKTQHTPGGGTLTKSTIVSSAETGTIGYSVEHPTTFITEKTGSDWMFARNNLLWGNQNNMTTWNYYPHPIGRKSIYDPCPEGYCVPPQDAFSMTVMAAKFIVEDNGMQAPIAAWNALSGSTFYYEDTKPNGNTVYLPWAGSLHRSKGNLVNASAEGTYWTNTNLKKNNANAATRASFNISTWNPLWGGGRAMGQSVRCMKEIR